MFKFTEEQIMIRDMVREFTKNEVEPRDKWMDENGFDWEVHKKLCEAGLMGIHLPEQYGGGGGDAVMSEIVINEIAKGSASVALFLDADWLAADMIYVHGSEEQKNHYLPLAAEGKIFAFGLTESNAGVADYYLIMAKTDPEAGAKGISVFIVPKDAEGLTVGKFEHKMGMCGSATCELSFDNIKLPADALVGKEGAGFKIAMMALDGAGLAQHAMEVAKNYANERVTFGKPIAKYQGVAFKFADMAAKIRAIDLMVWDTAQMKSEGQRHTVEAAELKLLEIGEGTSEIQRMVISGAVLAK